MGTVIDFATHEAHREVSNKLTELVLFHPRAFLDLLNFCNNPGRPQFSRKSLDILFERGLIERTLRVPLEVRSAMSQV